jgi:transcriptional regulator with GAF, ATPase, and Fis domain
MSATALHEQFAAIAAQLRDGRTVEQTYDVIVRAALVVVDGCDRAAIGVLNDAKFTTAAATDDVMSLIDQLQNDVGEGPCLEASIEATWQLDNDISVASKWPRLAALVVGQTPVRAMLAVPLVDARQRGGALNLFADRPHAFTDESTESAALLAAFATIALSAARQAQRADELQVGLSTNREIGAAVGILMATHGMSNDEAFAVLSRASQRLNRKLRDIAAGIVHGEGPDTG